MPLKISRILHAGYVFESNLTQIAFDPIFENPFSHNCYAFPNIKFDHEKIKSLKFSAVFISHFHDDHCSLESLIFIDRKTPIYIYCIFPELTAIIRKLGFDHVYQLEIDVPVHIASIEVIPRRALDLDVDSLFQIKAQGLNILNVVDSWIDSETLDQLAQYAPWDMILWPFQTLREIEVLAPSRALAFTNELPIEWLNQLQILRPRYIVPSSCQFVQESWSWYNQALFPITYAQFERQIKIAVPQTKVVRLNPSVSILLDQDSIQFSESLCWVEPLGPQDVDYDFNPNLRPPTTAEISVHFQPLTTLQAEKVFKYCSSGLIEKYNSREAAVDPYFKKTRLWRLSVYDHVGLKTEFFYKINNDTIILSNENAGVLSWTTEIPVSKLFAALELGESLTSMYMRINDVIFDEQIEKEIGLADIIEDPLIRCLFSGHFAAYQLAQLKRING